MQQFWKIIQLLLLLKVTIISSNNCQSSDTNSICNCSQSESWRYYLHCPINSTRKETDINIEIFTEGIVKIHCLSDANNLLDFDHNLNSFLKNVKKLSLYNCHFEDIEIQKIASSVGAENIEILEIANRKANFVTLHKNQFLNLTNLKRLDIFDTRLNDLAQDLLQFTPNITTLMLRNTQIKSIPKNFFQFTPNLEIIELGINKLKVLEDGTFGNLNKLLFLSLFRNELTNLDSNIFGELNSVETINLFSNKLTTLPANIFHKNVNLRKLNLSHNLLANLPSGLFQKNQNLKILRIDNPGNFTTLPNGFLSNLTNLLSVQLDGSKLESLPEDIFEGSNNLVNISMQKNHFVSLPANVFNGLNKLERLELNYNKLENLDDKLFDSCTKLKHLFINNNNIVTISKFTFSKLANLETLFMERNKITSIDTKAFYSLYKLKKTSFAFNNLTTELTTVHLTEDVCLSVFYQCHELEELNLSYNKISLLCDDWTGFTGHLNSLKLSHNNISSLTVDNLDMKNAKDLNVDLTYNKITNVNLTDPFNLSFEKRFTDEESRSKVVLNLHNNPIKCDCVLYEFLRYLDGSMISVRDKLIIDTGAMKCFDSKKYEGILLTQLDSKSYNCIPPEEEIDDYKMCPEECDQWITPADKKFIFNCSHRNLNQAPEKLCSLRDTRYVKELDLAGNNITIIPNLQQIGYNLTRLTLSHNRIASISKNAISHGKLEKLELDNNQLTKIAPDVIRELETFAKTVKLGNNPWQCDCEAKSLQDFASRENTTVEDKLNIICHNSNKTLTRLTINELCPSNLEIIVIASVMIAVLGMTFGIMATFYYRYQQHIKVWLYANNLCLWCVTEEVLDSDKPYDAFVSYSHEDEEFVINEIIANLENGPRSFKLCVHFRDWLAGEWIPLQIAKSIRDSRRTIVVLSPNFIASEWGKMEFRTAHKEALAEGRARIIVVLYGDIGPVDKLEPDLQAYLTMNTYVKWGDPWFWNKLRYALPHKSDAIFKSSKFKNFSKAHPIEQLTFNRNEVKQFSESGLTPLNGNGKIFSNEKVVIDMSDDECNKLNTRI